MFLKLMHVRIAMALAGLVVFAGYLAAGGHFGQKSSIVIEFGMAPQEFNGLDVEIDGKVVGKLTTFGQATRTAFAVRDGEHIVRVLHPEYGSIPRKVETGAGAHEALLLLDFAEVRNEAGEPELAVTFQ